MRIKSLLVAVIAMGVFLIAGCGQKAVAPGDSSAQAQKLKVVASVYPVYEFVSQVGRDKVEVALLVPAGAEPHDWEPSAKDLINVKNAKLFFFHGANLEHWVDKVIAKDVLGATTPIEVSKNIELRTGGGHHHEHEHDAADKDNHKHEAESDEGDEIDPHVWLDPLLAQQEVTNIAEALAVADPVHASYYQDNAAKYNAQLQQLHQEYQDSLQSIKKRTIITNHAAFGYLAARYNLEQVAIMGLSPDAEPTPEKMADIVKLTRERQIKYLFSETIVNPALAETLAKETGAKVLVLHPLDALTPDEMKQGKNYLILMRENLTQLKLALGQ